MIASIRIFALCFIALVSCPCEAQQTHIFFGTIDTITGRDMHRPNPGAFMDFFTPDAPWQQSARKVDYFQISTQFILASTDEQLKTVFSDLKRRGIPVSISMGASQREPGCCGGEGYLPANIVDVVGKRLTRNGFSIAVMEMDEPIWFAHEVSWGTEIGNAPCHYPLPKLVAQVALTVKHMRQYFPDLKVGDIEVIADYTDRKEMNVSAVVNDYVEFSRLFERATGTKLAFFHSDIAWRTNWRSGKEKWKTAAGDKPPHCFSTPWQHKQPTVSAFDRSNAFLLLPYTIRYLRSAAFLEEKLRNPSFFALHLQEKCSNIPIATEPFDLEIVEQVAIPMESEVHIL